MWTDLINDENLQDMQNLQRIDPKYMQVENSKEQLVSTDVDHTGESSDADITTASQPNSEKTKKQTDFCVKCGKTFTYLGQLSRHIQAGCMKSKEIRIKCPSCNQELRRGSLARHMRTHQLIFFPCAHCPRKFKSQTILEKHMFTHKLKTCSLCKDKFKNRHLLEKH